MWAYLLTCSHREGKFGFRDSLGWHCNGGSDINNQYHNLWHFYVWVVLKQQTDASCCVMSERAFDEQGHLKQPKEVSINKVGHGKFYMIGIIFNTTFVLLHQCLSVASFTWARPTVQKVLRVLKNSRCVNVSELQKASAHSVHVHIQGKSQWLAVLQIMWSAHFTFQGKPDSSFDCMLLCGTSNLE